MNSVFPDYEDSREEILRAKVDQYARVKRIEMTGKFASKEDIEFFVRLLGGVEVLLILDYLMAQWRGAGSEAEWQGLFGDDNGMFGLYSSPDMLNKYYQAAHPDSGHMVSKFLDLLAMRALPAFPAATKGRINPFADSRPGLRSEDSRMLAKEIREKCWDACKVDTVANFVNKRFGQNFTETPPRS